MRKCQGILKDNENQNKNQTKKEAPDQDPEMATDGNEQTGNLQQLLLRCWESRGQSGQHAGTDGQYKHRKSHQSNPRRHARCGN